MDAGAIGAIVEAETTQRATAETTGTAAGTNGGTSLTEAATEAGSEVMTETIVGVRVTVPASTANLGSGFDALGMALGLYDTVEVRVTEHSGVSIIAEGCGADSVPRDESHLVLRALRIAQKALDVTLPGLDLYCRNAIPHARGLGSSASAIVAGITAAYGLAGRKLDDCALQLAGEMEGHADNVAASLYGGAVIAWRDDDGRYRASRLEPHADIRPVALVPEQESLTKAARDLLPDRVPHADAAFAAGRAALVVQALTRDPGLLLPATAELVAKRNGLNWNGGDSLYDPSVNIELGTRYLAQMAERFNGAPWLASAAYNAGPNRVDQWLAARGTLTPDLFVATIPFKETREYVARVMAFSVIYDWRLHGTAVPLTTRLSAIGQPYGLPNASTVRRPISCSAVEPVSAPAAPSSAANAPP